MFYPHLPKTQVKSVILGEKYKDILNLPLRERGILPIYLESNKNIESQLGSHVDLNFFQVSESVSVLEPSLSASVDAIYGESKLSEGYPNNIAYCGLLIGKHFFHNLAYTDKKLLSLLPKEVSLHNVSQGFSKCMVCVVDEFSAITSDIGMYNAMKSYLDVLLISQGNIDLEGYDYGFIGGSSFKRDKNTICFTGKLDNHPDFSKITAFLDNRNIQIDYLTNRKIFDIGGVLPKI